MPTFAMVMTMSAVTVLTEAVPVLAKAEPVQDCITHFGLTDTW